MKSSVCSRKSEIYSQVKYEELVLFKVIRDLQVKCEELSYFKVIRDLLTGKI